MGSKSYWLRYSSMKFFNCYRNLFKGLNGIPCGVFCDFKRNPSKILLGIYQGILQELPVYFVFGISFKSISRSSCMIFAIDCLLPVALFNKCISKSFFRKSWRTSTSVSKVFSMRCLTSSSRSFFQKVLKEILQEFLRVFPGISS